jgi:DNA recombination-dependent growth factor C
MGELHDSASTDRIRRYRELANQAEDDAQSLRYEKATAHFLLLAKRWRQLAEELEAAKGRRRSHAARKRGANR